MAARDLSQRTSPRQHRNSEPHLYGALDPIEARQGNLNVERRVATLVDPEHAFARRRWVVVSNDRLAAHFFNRYSLFRCEPMTRVRQHDQLVAAKRDRLQPLVGWLKRQHTEIEAALEEFRCNLPRRHSPDLDARPRVLARELLDDVQERMHGRFIRTDDDTPVANVLQLPDGRLSFCRKAQQSDRMLLQQQARFGQGAVARCPIEQLVAKFIFQSPDRLADGRLRSMQFLGGLRKASIVCDGDKRVQVLQLHFGIIRNIDKKSKTINLTKHPGTGSTVMGGLMSTDRLTIFDTTLRDGEQAPGFSMRIDEKLKLARQLATLGVDLIEAGFPIASEADAESVRVISEQVRGPVIAALARCHPADIDRAGEALATAPRRRIHVFIATSDLHLQRKLRMTREACLDAAVAAIHRARRFTEDIQFSAEDATRSDMDFLCRVIQEVISAGCTTVNLPDTVGYSTPDEIGEFFRTVLSRVANAGHATFSAHCHDDLGLAVANTLAAVRAGARQVECTVNGIGERAGNASLEEIVMATRVRSDLLPYTTGIEPREIYPSSQMLTALTGEAVQANKAIVGRNAFAHEAGIHQDGMLKDRRTYEIMRPEEVGVPQATLVIGKHSGRHAVQRRCEQIGLALERHEVETVYWAIMAIADREKVVSDRDLADVIGRIRGKRQTTGTAASVTDFNGTPAEVGYGHGV